MQLPSIFKQKILKITLSKEDDDEEYNHKNSHEYKIKRAKKIIFGEYAEIC
jgi:hypothetical protein